MKEEKENHIYKNVKAKRGIAGLGLFTLEDIKKGEFLLNTRPSKRLGGLTPYEVYYKLTGVAIGS